MILFAVLAPLMPVVLLRVVGLLPLPRSDWLAVAVPILRLVGRCLPYSELVLPIVSSIIAKATEAFEDAKLAVAELGLELPIMSQLSSAVNVFEQNVGKKFVAAQQRLSELQADDQPSDE